MALQLPHDRPSPSWLGVVLAAAAVLGLSALGCATAPAKPQTAGKQGEGQEGAVFVERALRRDGLRFGTDGKVRSLWGYMSRSHQLVMPAKARRGDVLFFDTRPTADAASCDESASHAGIVEAVAPDGRITFVEARGGLVRESFVDPAHPSVRRDARGAVANSFLRAKSVDDPPGARVLAGQMLCGVARRR